MSAGDSKNEPHWEKSPLSPFSVGTQSQGIRHQTSAASGAKTQSHNAIQHMSLCIASAHAQPRKVEKESSIKMVFSFPPEERVPFSQPRKDDGACIATVRAPSQPLSTRAMGQRKTSKRRSTTVLLLLIGGKISSQIK